MSGSIFNLKDKFIFMASIFFIMAFFLTDIVSATNLQIISDIAKKYEFPVVNVAGLSDAVMDSVRLREAAKAGLATGDSETVGQTIAATQNILKSLDKITQEALVAGNMVVLSKVMEIKSNMANSLAFPAECAAKTNNPKLGAKVMGITDLILNDMNRFFDWASIRKGDISSKIADSSIKTCDFLSDITAYISKLAESQQADHWHSLFSGFPTGCQIRH